MGNCINDLREILNEMCFLIDEREVNIANYYTKKKDVIYIELLRMVVGTMIIFWFLGVVLNIAGGMIHMLLVIAVIIFIFILLVEEEEDAKKSKG